MRPSVNGHVHLQVRQSGKLYRRGPEAGEKPSFQNCQIAALAAHDGEEVLQVKVTTSSVLQGLQVCTVSQYRLMHRK